MYLLAMVTLTKFLPSHSSIRALSKLRGEIVVYRPKKTVCGVTSLYLKDESELTVKLVVDYSDVVFKFEAFCISAEIENISSIDELEEHIKISEWSILCGLFRFEWRRPAIVGEFPNSNVKVVGEVGTRYEVPRSASSFSVSMVGIAFGIYLNISPYAVIMCDDEDPISLRTFDSSEEIDKYIRGCEIISLRNIESWSNDIDESYPYNVLLE